MKTKLTNIGVISGLGGTVLLGMSAIVAMRELRKARNKLAISELNVQVRDLYIKASDMEIDLLKRELEKAKSQCQGGES